MSGAAGEAGDGILALPARGVGEVRAGDQLVGLLHRAWSYADTSPLDGDVLVVTSKVVSKSEGRVVTPSPGGPDPRDAAVSAETDREVARRGATRVVRTRHGLVMAAAGVDASNVEPGSLVLLPLDPDASARRLREALAARGVNVAVVVSDTSGRAWRLGQTDIAVGAAGLVVLDEHHGRVDRHGNPLQVTAPAVADEVAGLAELATGKLSGSPACLVRGLTRFVLPLGEHGPGARTLVRHESVDMFGLGAREAVVAALGRGDDHSRRGFGAPAGPDDVRAALSGLGHEARSAASGTLEVPLPADPFDAGAAAARVAAVVAAHGWRVVRTGSEHVSVEPNPPPRPSGDL